MYEMESLSTSEYMGWIAYFEEQNRKAEGKSGNLLAVDEDELVGALTSGD